MVKSWLRPWSVPRRQEGPVLVLVRVSVLVGVVWRRRCPLVGMMSHMFYPRPHGVSSIVEGRMEVCLHRILRDSVGASLRGSI